MASKRRRRIKRAAEVGVTTAIVLGLGAVVAGVAIYEWTRPAPPTTGAPAQLTPTGTGVQTAIGPNPASVT